MKTIQNVVVSTYERINILFKENLQYILQEEQGNMNYINLYNVGEYWVAFEHSAYLLEQMVPNEEHPLVLYMKLYPFPIVMHSSHYLRVKELCRQHALSKCGMERLQFVAPHLDTSSYRYWYSKLCY